jgi:hypothetical protein
MITFMKIAKNYTEFYVNVGSGLGFQIGRRWIRIRRNDADLTRSGSAALVSIDPRLPLPYV